jgi:hypothetical protein
MQKKYEVGVNFTAVPLGSQQVENCFMFTNKGSSYFVLFGI